jgi:hypothetical protein
MKVSFRKTLVSVLLIAFSSAIFYAPALSHELFSDKEMSLISASPNKHWAYVPDNVAELLRALDCRDIKEGERIAPAQAMLIAVPKAIDALKARKGSLHNKDFKEALALLDAYHKSLRSGEACIDCGDEALRSHGCKVFCNLLVQCSLTTGNLIATGNAAIGGSLTVHDNLSVDNNAVISGDATIGGDLTVGGFVASAGNAFAFITDLSAQAVAADADVTFSNVGNLFNITHAAAASGITLLQSGVYAVAFTVTSAAAEQDLQQFALRLNGAAVANSTFQQQNSAANILTLKGQAIITASAGQVLTLRNVGANPVTLVSTAATSAGFSASSSASIQIVRIA